MNSADPRTILHIATGLGDGGAEAMLYRICRALPQHRHRIVSLGAEGKYGPLLRAGGFEVTALGMPRGRLTFSGLARLVLLIRKERPDAVQCWMYHANLVGGLAARLAGVGAVFWGIHNAMLDPRGSSRGTRLVSRISALVSTRVPRRIVSCSRRAASIHVAQGYAASKWVVIANGYDTRIFAPDAAARRRMRRQLGIGRGDFVIGNVARHDPDKDHANLFAALGILQRERLAFTCVLAGTGMTSTNPQIAEGIRREGLTDRVVLLGARSDIAEVMNGFDLHVLASRSEAFPNVVAETMACGVPNVTTDVGDAAVIVGDTGWVVRPGDPQALAEAVLSAHDEFAHTGRWRRRRTASRDRITRSFALEAVSRQYESVWLATREASEEGMKSA
jgi:glycosyltransferase involved in cell wall biosynthesis